ncbi:hypothetical protein [Brevundimonas diminuta]|uniref:hypothetical protein n=1 Tax=Brevundimonas diminuta TaxID=293 RepID=UPI003F80A8EF
MTVFLLGSQAARLTRCLPAWREGRTGDADLVVDAADANTLLDRLAATAVAVRRFEAFPDRTYVLTAERLLIDVQTSDHYADLLAALPDNQPLSFLGFDVLAISMTTQLVIKRAYADLPIHREKNDRDIAHWDALVSPLDITPAHDAVAAHVRFSASVLPLLKGK